MLYLAAKRLECFFFASLFFHQVPTRSDPGPHGRPPVQEVLTFKLNMMSLINSELPDLLILSRQATQLATYAWISVGEEGGRGKRTAEAGGAEDGCKQFTVLRREQGQWHALEPRAWRIFTRE